MKDIYINETEVYVNLKNGEQILVSQGGRSMYQYGDMPENRDVKISGEDNGFKYLKTFMIYPYGITLFKHREYFYVLTKGNYKKIYKSQIDNILILYRYTKIEKPRMEWVKKDLDFYTYSQLVFDREQDLKEMLIE